MEFHDPYTTSDAELERALGEGRMKFREDRYQSPLKGLLTTVVWIVLIGVATGFLLATGMIDPGFCNGSANPLSC
jgi:hypothetical protein